MAGTTSGSETLWNQSLQRQLSRVRGAKYRDLFTTMNYQSFQHSLTALDKSYNDKRLNSSFHKLEPVFGYLNNFSNAISTAIQSNPQIAALVWGGIQAALTVSVLTVITTEVLDV
jgi:hypothetical protein